MGFSLSTLSPWGKKGGRGRYLSLEDRSEHEILHNVCNNLLMIHVICHVFYKPTK